MNKYMRVGELLLTKKQVLQHPTCLWDNESVLAWYLADVFKEPEPLPSCQHPAKGTELKTRNYPRADLSGSCFSVKRRETQAPSLPGQKTKGTRAGPRQLACSSTVAKNSKMTSPTQEFAQSYLVKPKLWGAGRTGFCQDKHKRVREMLVWLINATHLRQQLWVCPYRTSVIAWLWQEVPSATATGN